MAGFPQLSGRRAVGRDRQGGSLDRMGDDMGQSSAARWMVLSGSASGRLGANSPIWRRLLCAGGAEVGAELATLPFRAACHPHPDFMGMEWGSHSESE